MVSYVTVPKSAKKNFYHTSWNIATERAEEGYSLGVEKNGSIKRLLSSRILS